MQLRLIRLLGILFLVINISISNTLYSQTSLSSESENNTLTENLQNNEFNDDLLLNQINQNELCFVPCDEILRIRVKDAVETIDNPIFVNSRNEYAPFRLDTVLGVVVDGVAKAYPYNMLSWHEIVNDVFGEVYVSITYSPLTATGISYITTSLDNAELGTSGYVYENNPVFYDRVTNTQFSQMGNVGLRGEKIGTHLPITYAIETTWEAWQKLYPNTEVLSSNTGSPYLYDTSPIGLFYVGDTIYYQTSFDVNLFPYNLYHAKASTHVIKIMDEVLLMPFQEIAKELYINHNFNDEDLFTIYSITGKSAITYSAKLSSGISLSFSVYNDTNNLFDEIQTFGHPLFIDDKEKSIWNYKGVAILGPLEGQKLDLLPTYNAYWYAASAYFQDFSFYTTDGIIPSINSTSSPANFTNNFQRIFSLTNLLITGFIVLVILLFPRGKNIVKKIFSN